VLLQKRPSLGQTLDLGGCFHVILPPALQRMFTEALGRVSVLSSLVAHNHERHR
jgi:hypothetical protein